MRERERVLDGAHKALTFTNKITEIKKKKRRKGKF